MISDVGIRRIGHGPNADVLDLPVERSTVTETTALGAAYLAGLKVGFYRSIDDISEHWKCDRVFQSSLGANERERLYTGWLDAVRRVRDFSE